MQLFEWNEIDLSMPDKCEKHLSFRDVKHSMKSDKKSKSFRLAGMKANFYENGQGQDAFLLSKKSLEY